jgi:hypothetical protein
MPPPTPGGIKVTAVEFKHVDIDVTMVRADRANRP